MGCPVSAASCAPRHVVIGCVIVVVDVIAAAVSVVAAATVVAVALIKLLDKMIALGVQVTSKLPS